MLTTTTTTKDQEKINTTNKRGFCENVIQRKLLMYFLCLCVLSKTENSKGHKKARW